VVDHVRRKALLLIKQLQSAASIAREVARALGNCQLGDAFSKLALDIDNEVQAARHAHNRVVTDREAWR
jgi:hypothetical protein